MPADQKDTYIHYLVDKVMTLTLTSVLWSWLLKSSRAYTTMCWANLPSCREVFPRFL